MEALACKMRCMRSQLLGRIVVTASLLGALSCVAQTQDEVLLKQLQPIITAHHGKVALYAVQLNTGKSVGINETKPDNTATNLAIDRFGVEPVNARMEALGLSNTHLYKKVMKPATGPMPADQPKF